MEIYFSPIIIYGQDKTFFHQDMFINTFYLYVLNTSINHLNTRFIYSIIKLYLKKSIKKK